jgi:hypothetical protein
MFATILCQDGWNERCHPFTWTKTAEEPVRTSPPLRAASGACRMLRLVAAVAP